MYAFYEKGNSFEESNRDLQITQAIPFTRADYSQHVTNKLQGKANIMCLWGQHLSLQTLRAWFVLRISICHHKSRLLKTEDYIMQLEYSSCWSYLLGQILLLPLLAHGSPRSSNLYHSR